jgi:hypothetical protein
MLPGVYSVHSGEWCIVYIVCIWGRVCIGGRVCIVCIGCIVCIVCIMCIARIVCKVCIAGNLPLSWPLDSRHSASDRNHLFPSLICHKPPLPYVPKIFSTHTCCTYTYPHVLYIYLRTLPLLHHHHQTSTL